MRLPEPLERLGLRDNAVRLDINREVAGFEVALLSDDLITDDVE
jgi:hypothetical protein